MKKYILVLVFPVWMASANSVFQPSKVGFEVTLNGEINSYSIFSLFVMPGGKITFESKEDLIFPDLTDVLQEGNGKWIWNLPSSSGLKSILIQSGNETMTINLLIMTPMAKKEGAYLNGYRIGSYPSKPLNGNPIYNGPEGLFEVTEDMMDLKLTPHFTLKQFVCKQTGDFPKYLIVRERLLLKLEYLLEKTNKAGYSIDTFGFISGYRTPYYNASIKNVQYSRHVYGGAADIFIDQDSDGNMDDLNKDGVIDERDVRLFYNLVDEEFQKPDYEKFRGGLGFYKKNSRHMGFIHVDVRGWKSRWG